MVLVSWPQLAQVLRMDNSHNGVATEDDTSDSIFEPGAEYYDRSGELLRRLKQFALRSIRLYTSLPKTEEARILGRQILRSGTSPGAQYAEARRAKSKADYISKLGGVLQELEETLYWIDLLQMSTIIPAERAADYADECDQLIRIFATMLKNTRTEPRS